MNPKVKCSELGLGDVVKLYDGPYCYATVKNINKEEKCVTLFRPYVQIADFEYTGGVICYIGIEEFRACFDTEYELVDKGKELK